MQNLLFFFNVSDWFILNFEAHARNSYLFEFWKTKKLWKILCLQVRLAWGSLWKSKTMAKQDEMMEAFKKFFVTLLLSFRVISF